MFVSPTSKSAEMSFGVAYYSRLRMIDLPITLLILDIDMRNHSISLLLCPGAYDLSDVYV